MAKTKATEMLNLDVFTLPVFSGVLVVQVNSSTITENLKVSRGKKIKSLVRFILL